MCHTNSIANNLKHFLAREDHQIKFSKAVELQAMFSFVIKNSEWHNVPKLAALAQDVMGVAIKTRIEMYVQETWIHMPHRGPHQVHLH
jgi:hypothetical protein